MQLPKREMPEGGGATAKSSLGKNHEKAAAEAINKVKQDLARKKTWRSEAEAGNGKTAEKRDLFSSGTRTREKR